METLIILLIWGGLAGLSYVMKKKQQDAAARSDAEPDWRDELPSFEEWKQAFGGEAAEPPPLPPSPAVGPPPVPAPSVAVRETARSVFMDAFERQVAVQQATAAAAPPDAAAGTPSPAPGTRSATPGSIARTHATLRPEAPRMAIGGIRHTRRTVHIRGRTALRRAVIAREILDRPRAFDI
jgi:hypothetical protein